MPTDEIFVIIIIKEIMSILQYSIKQFEIAELKHYDVNITGEKFKDDKAFCLGRSFFHKRYTLFIVRKNAYLKI